MSKKDVLAKGKFLSLTLLNGYEMVERINCDGVVLIMPFTDAGEVVLVEQYRPAVVKRVIEFPAGLVNDIQGQPRESMESAARRELLEETGFDADEMKQVGEWPSSCGMSNEIVQAFLARGLVRKHEGGGEDDEDITVHVVSLREIDKWLEKKKTEGCLIDPKIYTGLYLNKR